LAFKSRSFSSGAAAAAVLLAVAPKISLSAGLAVPCGLAA